MQCKCYVSSYKQVAHLSFAFLYLGIEKKKYFDPWFIESGDVEPMDMEG